MARIDWTPNDRMELERLQALLGDETLYGIARELVATVKRVLCRHGYPPDRQESATRTVLEQAEVISAGWAA